MDFPMPRARVQASAEKFPSVEGRRSATTNSSAKRDRSITTLRDEVDRSHQIYLAHNWLPSYRLEVGRYLTQIRAVLRARCIRYALFPEIYCVRWRNDYDGFSGLLYAPAISPEWAISNALCVLFLIFSAVQTVYFESQSFNELFRLASILIKAEIKGKEPTRRAFAFP